MDEKRKVMESVEIPLDIFEPLIKECFNEYLSPDNAEQLVLNHIYPLYKDFNMYLKHDSAVIARGLFPSKDDSCLISIDSLIPYTNVIKASELSIEVRLTKWNGKYHCLLNIFYDESDMEQFQKEKYPESKILSEITEKALAYYYWCLLNISNGKRIGLVAHNEKQPDITGKFMELMMDLHFPLYDKKKAYSFEVDDYLRNASEAEIGDRLVDMISDFKEEYKMHGNTSVLTQMQIQIEKFGKRLKWDSSKFFKENHSIKSN
jgi:hypothetical protein